MQVFQVFGMKPKLESKECNPNLSLQMPRQDSPSPPGGKDEMHAMLPGSERSGADGRQQKPGLRMESTGCR